MDCQGLCVDALASQFSKRCARRETSEPRYEAFSPPDSLPIFTAGFLYLRGRRGTGS